MLGFFRRYQRYFFLAITIVIVISFSFFGTYSTIPAENIREQVAFTAIDGTQVPRSDLDEMVLFLSTDADDKLLFGGAWGPNFFNDGVIRKDLLQTGLAEILAAGYEPLLADDLQKRLEKEKRFSPYSHPEAPFIGVESVWEYFAPQMKPSYATLKRAPKASSEDAFEARVRLYLGSRRLPAPMMLQVLRYQEQQNGWVTPDASLDRTDLSLFGYHTTEDWFGSNFMHIAAEFIINASKVAEKQGYVVTKDEAWADLVRNAQASYQQNLQSPHLGVSSSGEYINEQLQRMHMDQSMAVNVWRQVLLFRRLFQDIGQSVLVDAFSFENVQKYAKESATGDIYQLPKELQLHDYAALQKLETYLQAVAKRPADGAGMLLPPSAFFSADEVAKKYPELVEKRYFLEIAQANVRNLQSKVSVKDSWSWQVEDKSWALLKKEFPEIALKPGNTREERFSTLESLDGRTRTKIDAFARKAVLEERPEIIEKALQEAKPIQVVAGVPLKGESPLFTGVKDPKKLIALLDQAPLAGEEDDAPESAQSAQQQLNAYSQDKQHYYRVRVLEKKPELEVLTFAEADQKKALQALVDAQLEAHYQKVRTQNPALYQKEDKTWKPLADVRTAIADQYFSKILQATRQDYVKAGAQGKQKELPTGDLAAPYRLYAYVRKAKEALESSPEKASDYVREQPAASSQKLAEKDALTNQWKLEKKAHQIERSKEEKKLDLQEVLAMPVDSWTSVQIAANGEIYFFHKRDDAHGDGSTLLLDKIEQARRLLSDDAQRAYMRDLVAKLKAKKAISLDYLNLATESLEDPQG